MLIVNQIITSMDASCMWSLSKSFISCSLWQLIYVALMLCLRFWITSLLSLRLVILIHARFIHATWDFLWEVCSVVVLLVTTSNTTKKARAFYGQSTSGSIARHALVLRWLIMIHYATTPTCTSLWTSPKSISCFCLEIYMPDPNLVSLPKLRKG